MLNMLNLCFIGVKNSIKDQNGKAVIWKTGHSLIKAKIKEINAPLAGEMSGHIFFNDNWFGFDDAIYSALRCLQEIESSKKDLSSFLKTLPVSFSSPEIRIDCDEKIKFEIVKRVKKIASSNYKTSELLIIDGVSVGPVVVFNVLVTLPLPFSLYTVCEPVEFDGPAV